MHCIYSGVLSQELEYTSLRNFTLKDRHEPLSKGNLKNRMRRIEEKQERNKEHRIRDFYLVLRIFFQQVN